MFRTMYRIGREEKFRIGLCSVLIIRAIFITVATFFLGGHKYWRPTGQKNDRGKPTCVTANGVSATIHNGMATGTRFPTFTLQMQEMEYSAGANGCTVARESYVWRVHGFGSNINNMLNAWVWALSVQRWEDIALVVDPSLMDQVDCAESSNGLVSTGWNCLFSPMPHLCEFNSTEEWVEHMRSRGVSEDQVVESNSLTQELVRRSPDMIVESLEGMSADHFKALSVMVDYLWSHLTPWVMDDVRNVTHADAVAALHDVPFVGIHIRRGDKVTQHEANFYGVEQYLAAGVEFMLHSKGGHAWHGSIKGIWVASDDPNVIDEVRQLYPLYFPYVEPELIVWVSDGVQGALETKGVSTYSSRQRYPSYVYMLTDLEQLAKAEVFVGTFSSNVGRLVALLREAAGKSRKSSISIDRDWVAGRA